MSDSFGFIGLQGASAMARIDVMQSDRGLAACFQGAQLSQEWIDAYSKTHSLTTLDDFIFMITASEWEKSLLG